MTFLMKTYLKYLIPASAVMFLTGSVYATQSIYITDSNSIVGSVGFASSTSGTVSEVIAGVDGWSILVANGVASPPGGTGGTVQSPVMNLTITANYSGGGGAGSSLYIYFGSDGFGPTSSGLVAALSGDVANGTGLGVTYSTWDVSGSGVPSVGDPTPLGANTLTSSGTVNPSGGNYDSTVDGSISMSSYSLGERVTLSGSPAGSEYNLQASISVPEPSVAALAIVGAACALGMMRRRY